MMPAPSRFIGDFASTALRGHRVSGSLPCFDAALEHFDVGKAFRPVFGCLTDSARVGESRSIENDFLRLRQRSQPRSEVGQRERAVQIEHPWGFRRIVIGDSGTIVITIPG
jgi:hypothetical protein